MRYESKYLSGIRPTGKLHLGNYIGAVLPAIKYNSNVLIADLHAPFDDFKPLYAELQKYISAERIQLQSSIFNSSIYFKLLEKTSTGLLQHMPQYKVKEKNAHMFTYPVLMAHDLVGYDYVIVGTDQKPHIEFANDILHRIGVDCPEPIYEGGKIMSFRNSSVKMSKSDENSCLFLSDSLEIKTKKITKAIMDDAGRKNMEFICTSLGGTIRESNSDLKYEVVRLCENL